MSEEILFSDKLKLESELLFLEQGNRKLNYRDFKKFTKKISNSLQGKNIKNGSLVLLDIKDPFYLAGYVFACFHLKLKPALLNSYFKRDQVNQVLQENKYSLFITDQNHSEVETLNIDTTQRFEFSTGDLEIDLNSEILFFTSGSIQSKACVLTLKNFFYSALGSSENIPLKNSDTWGLCLPLFHVGGFSILIRALLSESRVLVLDNNKNYVEQLDGVTHVSFVSTQFLRYLDQFTNLGSLKYILLGGSAIPETALKKALELQLPIYKSYGMTEMASQISTTQKLSLSVEFKSSGHPLNYRELKILDKKIYVKGPCLFLGYLKKNELQSTVDQEGWFSTGDYGEFHQEGIHILGRTDRIYQSSGENISPELIEQELLKLPGVTKAYVCPEEDSKHGLRPVAYIEKDSSLTLETILKALSKTLPGLYLPKSIKSWDQSPKHSWKQ